MYFVLNFICVMYLLSLQDKWYGCSFLLFLSKHCLVRNAPSCYISILPLYLYRLVLYQKHFVFSAFFKYFIAVFLFLSLWKSHYVHKIQRQIFSSAPSWKWAKKQSNRNLQTTQILMKPKQWSLNIRKEHIFVTCLLSKKNYL